jgi:DNA polymerase-3 subunit epsilon
MGLEQPPDPRCVRGRRRHLRHLHPALHAASRILPVLLANARQRVFRIWALEAPIECKDLLKQRGYRCNGGEDGRPRAWYRDLDRDLLAEEELFLAEKVYGGECRHARVRIDYSNRFSARV